MRLAEIFVMVWLAVGLAGCEQKPPASAPAHETPASDAAMTRTAPVIVFLGDSLTAGYQLPPGAALPAAIQRRFDAAGVKAKLVNAGVSGDTTADGLNRYDFSVEGSGADLLVVALGANDFLNSFPPDIPRQNLAAILGRAKADGVPAVLVGVAIPKSVTSVDAREAAYAKIYPDLAAEFSIPYYADMLGAVAGKPDLLMQDGVHPTAEGVEAMAAAIGAFLTPLVEDLAAKPPETPPETAAAP